MAKKKGVRRVKKKKKMYTAVAVVVAVVTAVLVVRQLRVGEVAVEGKYFLGAADATVVIDEFKDFT